MYETTHPYAPGDVVLALVHRGGDRLWLPGTVRSVAEAGATVDFGGARPRRIPFSRLRLGAAR